MDTFIGIYVTTCEEKYIAMGNTIENVLAELQAESGENIPANEVDFYMAKPIKVAVVYLVEEN